MEPYSYTGNNPIMFTDPTGMSKEQVRNGGGTFDEVYNETRAVLERFIPKLSDYLRTINVE